MFEPESQTVEYKQIWKDEYLKTICAFANSDGGILYIGITDNYEVIGIEKVKQLLDVLPNKINNKLGIICKVKIQSINNKDIIKIIVNKIYAPISYNGKFYQRSGSNTIELSGSNLANFLLKKYDKTWDAIPVEECSISDIDLSTIEKFKKLAKDRIPEIDKETDIKQLLQKLYLFDGKYLNRAAVLLFTKNPQKYFIQSHSKIGKFTNEVNILTSDIIEGNLFLQVDAILDILKIKYLKSFISYDGIYRREKLEYPYLALREAIINSLIHRDYTNTSNLQIKVYDDRLFISNGALLSLDIPIDFFSKPHQSMPFNPLIASVFYKAGLIENWGRGTLNIIEECSQYGLPEPQFEYKYKTLTVTFFNVNKNDPVNDPVNKRQRNILYQIMSNKYITREELAIKNNVSIETIKRDIRKLRELKLIKRIGSDKTGFWQILDNNNKE